MSITRKLESLDELIWTQYEKVTHLAEKTVGWDKWDLVNASTNVTMAGVLGAGVYEGLLFWQNDDLLQLMFSAMYLGSAPYAYSTTKLDYKRAQREARQLEQGILFPPAFSSLRVSGMLFSGFSGACGVGFLMLKSKSDSVLLNGLLDVSVGCYLFALESAWYFRDQIPKLPSSTTPLLYSLYERVRGKRLQQSTNARYSIEEIV